MKVQTPIQQLFFTTSLIQTTNSSGTGFVVHVKREKGGHIPVLVTNKHVVDSPGPGSFRLMAEGEPGKPKYGESVNFSNPNFSSLWVGHSSPDVDIAAMLLGPFINDAASKGHPVFWRGIAPDLCPSDEVLEDLDAVEPIIFVGYPNALFDKSNLTPIARRGHTATPVALNYNNLPAFLIDASVFPGSSGSPVFIYQENGYRSGGAHMLGESRLLLAGIIASVHIQKDSGQIIVKSNPTFSFNQILDLGIVYNWTAIIETIRTLFKKHNLDYDQSPSIASTQVTSERTPPQRPE